MVLQPTTPPRTAPQIQHDLIWDRIRDAGAITNPHPTKKQNVYDVQIFYVREYKVDGKLHSVVIQHNKAMSIKRKKLRHHYGEGLFGMLPNLELPETRVREVCENMAITK
jgi:hypothetical protein